jgi:hypothetical protein
MEMAIIVFKDAKMLVGSSDLSGDLNEIRLDYNQNLLDATCFGNNTKINYPGIMSVDLSHSGLVQAGNNYSEEAIWNQVGGATAPISVIPSNSTPGDYCYFFRGFHGGISLGGAQGELYKFSGKGGANDAYGLVRGMVLEGGTTTRNATGNGTAVQVGNVSAAQYVYAAIHVPTFSGTSVVVTIKSAATSNMASNSTRFTFTTVSGKTSEYMARVAGAITDTYWRADWTVTTANAVFAVVLGIK